MGNQDRIEMCQYYDGGDFLSIHSDPELQQSFRNEIKPRIKGGKKDDPIVIPDGEMTPIDIAETGAIHGYKIVAQTPKGTLYQRTYETCGRPA